MLYYSGLSRTLRSCAGCFTRAAALFVTGCWAAGLPARTAPMAGRAAPCTLHAAARLRALPGAAGWGSRALPIHRPCPPRGAAGEISGRAWAAVELGVEMARLLFGSEIRMCGSEPLPEPVPGLDRGYDCILPVPASSKKRGYNVPERMAQPLARAVGVPVVSGRADPCPLHPAAGRGFPLTSGWPMCRCFRVARPEAGGGKAHPSGGRCSDHRSHGLGLCAGSAGCRCAERVRCGAGHGGVSAAGGQHNGHCRK